MTFCPECKSYDIRGNADKIWCASCGWQAMRRRERVYPTIEAFVESRLIEARGSLYGLPHPKWKEAEAELNFKEEVLRMHRAWPVLLQSEPKVKSSWSNNVGDISYSLSQKIEWLTQQEYRNRFGTEPPTAPILLAMAQLYKAHADFNPDWSK